MFKAIECATLIRMVLRSKRCLSCVNFLTELRWGNSVPQKEQFINECCDLVLLGIFV